MSEEHAPAIGIDLGTAFTRVGVFRNGQVDVLADDNGKMAMPNCVAFTEMERLIGDPAKKQAAANPTNTIFEAKRLLGRRFDHPRVPAHVKNWPVAVVDAGASRPVFQVQYHGMEMLLTAEEVISMVIKRVKEIAETRLETQVFDAVITVPACFNDSQRQATRDAGAIAGLRVLKVLNDPTAAALTYARDRNVSDERNILFFDLGAGVLDVSIVAIDKESNLEVKATSGSSDLGGNDFDNKMAEFLVEMFARKYKKDMGTDVKAVRRLLTGCEMAKRTLSGTKEALIEIESLFEGINFKATVSRTRFEEVCSDLFKSALQHVELALNDARLTKTQIHEVVLTGGASRIAGIQNVLQEFFEGKSLSKAVSTDMAVVYGAAMQAAILNRDPCSLAKEILAFDVTSASLGVEADGGVMCFVVKRATKIPLRISKVFTTCSDNQSTLTLQVFEGERSLVRDNLLLGCFEVSRIPPAPSGVPQIEVNFDIDPNGILSVKAHVHDATRIIHLPVTCDKGRLHHADIDRMISERDRYHVEDEKRREWLRVRDELEAVVAEVKGKLEIHDDNITAEGRTRVKQVCEETLVWLGTNAHATLQALQEKIQTVNSAWGLVAVQDLTSSSGYTEATATSDATSSGAV